MAAQPLTAPEREEIRAGIERGEPDVFIGERLGRHRCTINAEINRNGGRCRYRAAAAECRAVSQRARPKVAKLVADPELAGYVRQRLKAKDSPMTISIELARGVHGVSGSISHECIYRAIYEPGRGLSKGLHRGLHLRHRRRKRRGQKPNSHNHSLGLFNLIGLRPEIANGRSEVGHLEGDLITGSFNRSAIATLFDRASRYLWLIHLGKGTRADTTFNGLVKTLNQIPPDKRRTLTWDQGSEMARHHELASRCAIDIYFAEAKSPWQRPTNENGNALVRRYVGKGTDLSIYTPKQLQVIQYRINTIPRRVLDWATAHDLYTQATAQ